MMKVYTLMVIENIVTLIVTAAIILGCWYMGAGGYSFMGLLVLSNINDPGVATERAASEKQP